ncbi:DegT/DnrJ/EryC1/StrS family aminotransferase [Mesoterricola sediminis]|uniref:Glutamine--scyllo-inositol aminotransferase n=1 Tax=Mesoterricola sediminis TaxID=2927980 RepID=A0AA48GX25_9BACT|nr:DegT/DnrJ/EryC1/StrS family aminotransferase [Mesoterricola sediminis]BDU75647.1 glutamine--scyllo-inositol aminotransferase [Mesoterricola sediminis]
MSVPMLDLAPQNAAVKDQILQGLSGIIDRSSFVLGENVKGLEADLAQYAGARYAVGMSSGTDALLVALMALGVKHGDEVILPTFTFFATAGVVARLGATPVFVDLDPRTFNMTGALVEAAITPRTKAIIPVHLFGQLAEMPAIMAVADKHGIPVLEDACQSLGAKGWGRSAGEFGQMTACSFYPTKNLGAFGDAGLTLIRDDEALAARVRRMRVHGMEPVYVHHEIGMNGRIDEFQALVLRAKLPMLEGWHEGRRRHAQWYIERLKAITPDELAFPLEVVPDGRHIYNQFTVRVKGGRREALMAHLKSLGIGCAVYYPICLHEQPCFQYLGIKKGQLAESEKASQEVLSLPVFPEMTPAMLEEVAKALLGFFGK